MTGTPDIDFRQIAPRLGGQHEAFEELCCQLARRRIPANASYARLYGAGGDGGVECFADMPDGTRVGWQAKYVFDVDSLIRHVDSSLTTALWIHPTLIHYIVCFPFDPTGPTGRRGKSGIEKLDDWRRRRQDEAMADGRTLEIELWPASKLRSLLLELDVSGGLRLYFFDQTVLSHDWFPRHLDQVISAAGPRYTPELNVETELNKWFEAFGQTPAHVGRFQRHLQHCQKAHKKLEEAVGRTKADAMVPAWPEELRGEALSLLDKIETLLKACENAVRSTNASLSTFFSITHELKDILNTFSDLERKLLEDLKARHPDWKGEVDSPGFRQFMAEYMVSFPAANLDGLREAVAPFRKLYDWLGSPEGFLAFEQVFLLSGEAGVGKTHGICDVAKRRLQDGLLTCVAFGHRFSGEPDPWTRILEILGLPVTLGREGLLDALNAAGEASDHPLLLCVDAINETRPLQYWRNHLSELVQAVRSRPYLKLCISCRTPYVPYCVPEGIQIRPVEYGGFAGAEDYACQQFFEFYGLEPPVGPILHPEFKNPLYLRLVCETLRGQGKRRLPAGWRGLAPVIRAFISQKEKEFSIQHEIGQGANVVGCALRAISWEVARSGNAAISRSSALQVVQQACPATKNLPPVLDWLIGNGLLIEEAPIAESPLGEESAVRPAFERLGDFLVADSLLSETSSLEEIREALSSGGRLHFLVQNADAVAMHGGVLGALSILIPERHEGVELVDLIDNGSVRRQVLGIVIANLPWRSSDTFSSSTANLLREGLADGEMSFSVMDSVLSVAWQPSLIDAFWLDDMLRKRPMAQRDAYWCVYLHHSYESSGVVRGLIDAAFGLSPEQLEEDILNRWSVLLLWFTAAADRRVKDRATRAVTRLFMMRPEITPLLMERFMDCDDDAVRERVLLSAYGALILTRDKPATRRLAEILCRTLRDRVVQFDNALIRDHIRCILELAKMLEALPEDCDPVSIVQSASGSWPLEIPANERVKEWGDAVGFRPDEFFSDFFKYSMNCLRPWEHAVSKTDMGKWILQRVARDFGYVGSGCEQYDRYMLGKYGGGRNKPVWAERIGKKYQWIAMYQLASRLHDHVNRQRDSWEPEPLRTPLILLEERKLDPTLPWELAEEEAATSWWITASADLDPDRQLSDEEWVAREDDLPELEELLSIIKHDGQNWRLLVSYPSWVRRSEDAESDEPYRHVWMHINSYLVRKDDLAIAYDCLHRRNFFGRWMPEGATWLYGFAGEYPWATPFNTEPEEWHSRGGVGSGFPVAFQPSWNELAVEWEYDASLPRNFHMLVPARCFFAPSDLWWDGRDGHSLINGRTVFRDPSITEAGPSSLLADADDLIERLHRLGLRLIWTLLGEKRILGGPHDKQTPRRTFSQIAYLDGDGALHVEERVFFDDYDRDRGPNPNVRSKGNAEA